MITDTVEQEKAFMHSVLLSIKDENVGLLFANINWGIINKDLEIAPIFGRPLLG